MKDAADDDQDPCDKTSPQYHSKVDQGVDDARKGAHPEAGPFAVCWGLGITQVKNDWRHRLLLSDGDTGDGASSRSMIILHVLLRRDPILQRQPLRLCPGVTGAKALVLTHVGRVNGVDLPCACARVRLGLHVALHRMVAIEEEVASDADGMAFRQCLH